MAVLIQSKAGEATLKPGKSSFGSEVLSTEEVMRPDPVAGLGKWQKAIKVKLADGRVMYMNEHGQEIN